MPGLGDNPLLDVRGSGAHDQRHRRTKRLLTTECQHGHRQLAPGYKCLVIDSILIKGLELLEPGMHRTGLRVHFGVVGARGLRELLRIRRELVPEPIEIDPLATRHQPLGVGAPERKMPERVAADDIVPWSYP